MASWLIGTSGFAYPGWRGVFYPPDLPRRRWLEFYGCEFPIVELNVTFYCTPRESTYHGWADTTGPVFRFALKVPRLVSHIKRLAECREELTRFWRSAQPLVEKVAVVLLQTPPSLRFDATLLDRCRASLPDELPSVAWEVRHPSFFTDEALTWFSAHHQPLVVADSGGRFPTILTFTGAPAYLRFHGPAGLYTSAYTVQQLARYVAWVRGNVPPDATVYAFFNNDVGGHAVADARTLLGLLGGAAVRPG